MKIFIDLDPSDNCTNIILINTSSVNRRRYLYGCKIAETMKQIFVSSSDLALFLNVSTCILFDKIFPFSCFYLNKKRFLFFTVKPTNTGIEFSSNPAMIGKEVTITCSSNGQPKPSFTIIHNGTIHITGIEETYTIPNVNWDDAGYYTCVAINKLGSHPSDTNILNVTVKGKVRCKDVSSFFVSFI